MSFTLEVQTPSTPSDLAAIWKSALARKGITVEFPPNFTLENCTDVLVFKVTSAPAELTRLEVNEEVAAYFEFSADDDGFLFRTASGRTTVDFATQCLCAAALAEHLDAMYFDPQMGESARGADAYRLAMLEIEYFISDQNEKVFREFIDWETI
jgi:hypothetical protein